MTCSLSFDGVGEAAGDKLDFSGVDANTTTAGNNAFTFLGTAPLSEAGQVHVAAAGESTLIQGEIDGQPGVDFEILVWDKGESLDQWTAEDFIL